MESCNRAGRLDYLGLLLTSLATLMLEILLTRIFSVTLWYHLAFVAISVAMFGMTLGAMLVYLMRKRFTPERAWENLAWSAALFGVAAVLSVRLHLGVSVSFDPWAATSASALLGLFWAYVVAAVPFVFSGIAVSIALTQFPKQVGRLYAADLFGAAVGCILLIAVLDYLGAPLAVFVVAGLALAAAACFAAGAGAKRASTLGMVGLCVLGTLALPMIYGWGSFRITQAKGAWVGQPIYEKWNSYSRVAVTYEINGEPFGWGLSEVTPSGAIEQKHLDIDASAGTVMTRFDGHTTDKLGYLKYDVTNIAHYLRQNADVYVIGAGGGRDVLSALVFNQKSVLAVEMNHAIIHVVNGVFGDFTGHLDRNPKVRFVNDEARSYLTRTPERFDLIQISLIDTWAATAAGAFVLSENTLYTQDAWRLFLSRLKEGGILSVSRWYIHPFPGEIYRSVSLATSTLREAGVKDTRAHLLLVSQPIDRPNNAGPGQVATLLVSPQPFSAEDLQRVEAAAGQLHFTVLLSPEHADDEALAALADAAKVDARVAQFEADMSAPTDDRPFFFKTNSMLLNGLFAFVAALTLIFIILPVLMKMELPMLYREADLSLAFAGIGVAFMLIEVSQMQRLVVLLGHPTFSLSVALFGLLVSSGVGSWTCGRLELGRMGRTAAVRMAGLLAVLVVIGGITPPVVRALAGASTPLRVAVALGLLAPAGLFMGMAFPMLMRIATARRPEASAWFWGINGGASICASVLAVMISTTWGISAAWWCGVGCYVVASVMIVGAARRVKAGEASSAAAAMPAGAAREG